MPLLSTAEAVTGRMAMVITCAHIASDTHMRAPTVTHILSSPRRPSPATTAVGCSSIDAPLTSDGCLLGTHIYGRVFHFYLNLEHSDQTVHNNGEIPWVIALRYPRTAFIASPTLILKCHTQAIPQERTLISTRLQLIKPLRHHSEPGGDIDYSI